MVFAGIYPEDPDDYEELEKSLQKLCLTDGSVHFNYESSAALGSGFRCGFLGMLHLDVFRQRLEDEHDMFSIITAPTVSYRCKLRGKDKEIVTVDNPLEAPLPELIDEWYEAIVQATIITPAEYMKGIKTLCDERRGTMVAQEFMNNSKVVHFTYDIPLAELITDFFDMMKSISSGYASLDYEFKRFEAAEIVKVVFHLNGDPVDALTFLIHDSRAVDFAKSYCRKLKELLPA